LIYALLSAIFAALTSILGKIGIQDIESNLGTAIRTVVVLIIAWGIVFFQKKHTQMKEIDKKSWLFIGLSGLATGLSWLCYYRALQVGKASLVVPIDKLSIVVTVIFSYLVLKEKLSVKAFIGLLLVVGGTLLLLF
jgi:transporter family protein